MNGMNKINYNVDCEGRIEDYTVENTSDAKKYVNTKRREDISCKTWKQMVK
jgi:hypothetical protein